MNVRREDQEQASGGIVKVTREIPLWGILTVVGGFVVNGVTMYYGQQELAKNVDRLSTDVRTLTIHINDMRADQRGLQVQIEGLERRVTALETLSRSRP